MTYNVLQQKRSKLVKDVKRTSVSTIVITLNIMHPARRRVIIRVMVFKTTFTKISVISWQSVLLVIGTDCISSCKSNYHTIMATTLSQPGEI
jgi:hypothetical protein